MMSNTAIFASCTDQMHKMRRTLEQRGNFQYVTIMCFVDFASVFDAVHREPLWRIMAADGMPSALLRLINAYYASTKMKVRTCRGDSLSFEVRSCVRQGCALFPILFNDINECIPGQALQENPGI